MCLVDWQPVQGVPLPLSPEESWDRLQQIPMTLYRTKRVWMMDGWNFSKLVLNATLLRRSLLVILVLFYRKVLQPVLKLLKQIPHYNLK